MHIRITEEPLDSAALLERVGSDASGAKVLFLGTVRNSHEGRAVTGLTYSAYVAMAESELRRIVEEAASMHHPVEIAVEHRMGELGLGEVSVAIAVAHGHRRPALDACSYVIEQLKVRVPIWKLEHYVDGTRSWVDPTAGQVSGRV